MNVPLVLSDGKRPAWKIALAAALLTLVLLWAYAIFTGLARSTSNELWAYFNVHIFTPMMLTATGLNLLRIKTISIDGHGGKLTIRCEYGPFSDTTTKSVEWDYVSVFYDDGVYSVRLWYVKNRHFVLAEFKDKSSAMALATQISGRFNLGLLNATVRGQNQWVN